MLGDDERRDFFISHAGPDSEWAEWIGQQLETTGYTVELDVWEWSAGMDFVAAMERALDRASRVIAVWTSAYFGRTWTGVEARAGFAHGQAMEGWLIPVVVEDCDQQIPIMYRSLIRIELVGLPEHEARVRLLDRVKPPRRPAGPVPFPGHHARPAGRTASPAFPGRLPVIWGPVPARNLFFTGRDGMLTKLHRDLGVGPGRVAVTALQGIGGVGKTQLASEYAWRYAADYDLVWWVDAETPSGMAVGLTDLAAELGFTEGDVPTQVRQALAELGRRDRWLLIYDNATDSAALGRLLPPATGHVIVTSRDPAIRRVGTDLVEVGEFSLTETLMLLRRHAPELTDVATNRLAIALGDLPLAVDQAGAYLADTGMDPSTYIDLLAKQPQIMLADETVHHPGLVATVAAARARLADKGPTAGALLDKLAFLGPEPVPLAAASTGDAAPLPGSLVVADPITTHDAIAAISRLALARRSATTLQIHRLVQVLLRSRLTGQQAAAALTGALQLLATGFPGNSEDPTHWPAYAALLPHVRTVAAHLPAQNVEEPAGFLLLLDRTCWYLLLTGQYLAARNLAEQTRTRWSAVLGDDHPYSQTITTTLAEVAFQLGEPEAARDLNEDTLSRRRRLLGPDNLLTLASAANLAIRLTAVGEIQRARELGEDTLNRLREILGPDHPYTLNTASNLSNDLAMLGEVQAAQDLVEETLHRQRRVLGLNHPDTLRSAGNLAIWLAAVGEVERACELAEDTLNRERRVLGPDHPHTLDTAANLAEDLAGLGEIQAARRLAEDTLIRRRRVLGNDHRATMTLAMFIANLRQP